MPEVWQVERRTNDADALHHAVVPDPAEASMWICELTRPALVLGSSQDPSIARATVLDELGIDLVVRRSGGGAVFLDPRVAVWVDLIVPSTHRLWDPDVGRASHWVGDLWTRALAACGVDAVVHRGAMCRTEWSGLVCFAGLGPGEVTTPDGHKLVGVSQRRTRAAARFQTVAYLGDTSPAIGDLLALEDHEREALADALDAGTRRVDADAAELVTALTSALDDSLSSDISET